MPTTYQVHPAASLFPLLEGSRAKELIADIKAHGQRVPVTLWRDHDGEQWVLDGRNRISACVELGIQPRVEFWSGENPWAYVWSMNGQRRDLEAGQRSSIALELAEGEDAWEDAVAERMGRSRSGRKLAEPPECNVALGSARTTKEALAARAKVSARTAQKSISVKKADPELHKQVMAGHVKLNQAARRVSRKRAADAINAEPVPLPAGPFRVIVADPPWPYEKRKDDGSSRGQLDYPTMTIGEICALPVAAAAHQDCILWLWTTNAFLREAFRVLDAWGFREKTMLTWAKGKMGCGDWLRGQTEHCLLAIRGKPIVTLKNQTTLLVGAVKEHSRKPQEFYDLVEALCPGSKLEMFSRVERRGWQAWGAETGKLV